jgi:HlyD family secretion protein
MKKLVIGLGLLAIATGLGGWYLYSSDAPPVSFRTVRVERGDLVATVNATGTVEPEEVIDVGAQVAGQIVSFGEDPGSATRQIDYGSSVEKDTVLARIDESVYRAQVERARAQVESAQANLESAHAQVAQAEANVQKAEADLVQLQAKVLQSERDWGRAQRLEPGKAITGVEYDSAEVLYRSSTAAVAVGKATVAQTRAAVKDASANVSKAKATLSDARAALANAEINLGYCTIRSPVKGVIIDRRVNIGQTVVSSLNAPSLFLIAKDLKKLQVWASVNEADIGQIRSGQPVAFTVDTYPGHVFHGTVAPNQPRLNASMTQNVVTYTVVVRTDNPDGKLLPYLTANLHFEVSKRTSVLLVPNAALRWKPDPQLVAPDARAEYVRSERRSKGTPRPDGQEQGILWVEDGGFVRPVTVRVGLTDGLTTEIIGEGIREGDSVVIGERREESGGDSRNPFAPTMFRGKKS